MGHVLPVHPNPDIWAVTVQGRTGFQMLTPRAKKWAMSFKDTKPEDVENILWVPSHIGEALINELSTDTSLNIILDAGEMND